MASESEFRSSYESMKAYYKKTMAHMDEAIEQEENENRPHAIAAYVRCLELIDETFALPVGLPENIDAVQVEWNNACSIIQRLKDAKAEISYRLKVLEAQQAPLGHATVEAGEEEGDAEPAAKKKSMLLHNPPTYYDISYVNGTPRIYKEVIKALRDVIATENSAVLFDTLFQSQAKLYQIQPNGEVSTLAGETSMSLVLCTVRGKWRFLNGIYFIQCAIPDLKLSPTKSAAALKPNMIWLYPLMPTVTTCYQTEYGAFILPDVESNIPGTAFGLMISDPAISLDDNEQLSNLRQFFLDLLEAVLAGKVEQLKQQLPRRSFDRSEQMSKHIVTAANFISRNLVRGAEKTGDLIVKSTPYIISRMHAAPPDAKPVSSSLEKSVEVAKNVTSVAASVTGWVAGKIGSATMTVGCFMAPYIQSSGATLLQKGFGYTNFEANNKMEEALTIAAGAVQGFSTVYNGLETSAKILGTNLSANSVKIIEHKYGTSAGNVAAGTFDTIGNAFNVSHNVNYITPKGIAKRMAKNTGKAVVLDYQRNLRDESQVVLAGSLYPDFHSLIEN